MRAVTITTSGNPDVLQIAERPEVKPETWEVLVKVEAFGINRADVLQRKGLYPPPPGVPADIPGLEFAGIVEAVGKAVSLFRPGDRVFGLVGGGSYQERLCQHELALLPIPQNLSIEEAAAIPEAFITAFDALVLQAGLKHSDRVLISAVGSGVGMAAAQLALAYQCRVAGSSRSSEKLERAASFLGQPQSQFLPVLVEDGTFAKKISTAFGAIDVFLELVGGAYVEEDLKCAASKATIMLVGLLAGAKSQISLNQILARRIRVIGTTLRSRSLDEKIQVTQAFGKQILPLFHQGLLRPNLDSVFGVEEIAQAHAVMEADKNCGKLVVKW